MDFLVLRGRKDIWIEGETYFKMSQNFTFLLGVTIFVYYGCLIGITVKPVEDARIGPFLFVVIHEFGNTARKILALVVD